MIVAEEGLVASGPGQSLDLAAPRSPERRAPSRRGVGCVALGQQVQSRAAFGRMLGRGGRPRLALGPAVTPREWSGRRGQATGAVMERA
jgi:hypothetical protein